MIYVKPVLALCRNPALGRSGSHAVPSIPIHVLLLLAQPSADRQGQLCWPCDHGELTLSQLEVGMLGWAGEQALVLSPRQICAAAAQLSLGIRCAFNIPSAIKAARQLPENYQWGLVHISVPGVTISSHICTKQHFGGAVTGRILAHLRESPSLTGANSVDILGEDGWG